jgi:hypothetical protein
MPLVELETADTDRVVAALVWSSAATKPSSEMDM